jgi:hypothetical protein
MEGEDTGCLSELEKKGLHQAAGILENIMGLPVRPTCPCSNKVSE